MIKKGKTNYRQLSWRLPPHRTEGEVLRPASHPVLIERETPGDSGTAGPPRGTASQFLSPGAEGALYRPDALGMGGWLQLAVQLQKGSLRAKSR